MKQNSEPIHRWCSFSDSWPPSAVDHILSLIEVEPNDWIWDPFGGAGTTAVVAASKGISSITSDIDPLAVLVASTKAAPPTERILQEADWEDAQSLAQLVGYLSKRSASSRSERIRTMRFMVATSLLRSHWHLGKPFSERRVRTEYSRLRNEMLTDRALWTPRTKVRVYQSDFRAVVSLVRRSAKEHTIMVTSPPFIGSNDNPRLVKLERAIGLVKRTPQNRRVNDGKSYQRMLDSVAAVAVQVGCRAVAIELSARKPFMTDAPEWPPEFLAKKLEYAGYSTTILPFSSDKKDPSVLCLGRQMRTKLRLPTSGTSRLT